MFLFCLAWGRSSFPLLFVFAQFFLFFSGGLAGVGKESNKSLLPWVTLIPGTQETPGLVNLLSQGLTFFDCFWVAFSWFFPLNI